MQCSSEAVTHKPEITTCNGRCHSGEIMGLETSENAFLGAKNMALSLRLENMIKSLPA